MNIESISITLSVPIEKLAKRCEGKKQSLLRGLRRRINLCRWRRCLLLLKRLFHRPNYCYCRIHDIFISRKNLRNLNYGFNSRKRHTVVFRGIKKSCKISPTLWHLRLADLTTRRRFLHCSNYYSENLFILVDVLRSNANGKKKNRKGT
ncbi:unnamed protein product, partial [Lymnaea stagnalis]